MKITKQSILLAVLAIGFSFQLFLPAENSLLVQQVRAAGVSGTDWFSSEPGLTLAFSESSEEVILFLDEGRQDYVVGNYSESRNSIEMIFPKDTRASGKINGKKMTVKFYIDGKAHEYEFTRVR